MSRYRARARVSGFAVFLFCLLTLPLPGDARLPQGEELLALMAEHGGSARGLKLKQRQRIYSDGDAAPPTEVDETLRYRFPGQFRSDIVTETMKRTLVVSGGSVLVVEDGAVVRRSENVFERYKDLMLYRSRQRLSEQLAAGGLDLATTSLGRLEGRIAWVLGAQYPDETVSQIWLDRETFRPLRWLLVRRELDGTAAVLDIRYDKWKKTDGIWYPMHVAFNGNGKPLREIVVDEIQVDPLFEGDPFDTRRLEAENVSAPVPETPASENAQPQGEIDRTLEEFRRIFE